jgi:hypothetical protein
MKNSKNYWNGKNQKIEIWSEEVNGHIDYWEKINGISYPLSQKKFENRIKKYNL